MRVAVTGTPGTGKSSTCRVLSRKGYTVVDLDDLMKKQGLVERPRRKGVTQLVDVEGLRRLKLPDGDPVFIHSHLSHWVEAGVVVVLRCSPRVLEKRLRRRGWKADKVRENLEAEAIDVITVQALENRSKVYEVDTTSLRPEQTAAEILKICGGAIEGHEPGRIDWSEEVLSWY